MTAYQILQGLDGVSREKGLTRVESTATMRPIYDRPVTARHVYTRDEPDRATL